MDIGGNAIYEWQGSTFGHWVWERTGFHVGSATLVGAILEGHHVTDDFISTLNFKTLEKLDLDCPLLSVNSASTISRRSHIRALRLSMKQVDDEWVEWVAKLSDLETLGVPFTRVTDESVQKLRALKYLRNVDISFSHVSSDGARALLLFPQLEFLCLSAAQAPPAFLKYARATRPDVHIEVVEDKTARRGGSIFTVVGSSATQILQRVALIVTAA